MKNLNKYKEGNNKKKMVSELFHIKINGNDENKKKGFNSLVMSGASIICLEDEEYIVPQEVKEKLDEENKIDFKEVPKTEC